MSSGDASGGSNNQNQAPAPQGNPPPQQPVQQQQPMQQQGQPVQQQQPMRQQPPAPANTGTGLKKDDKNKDSKKGDDKKSSQASEKEDAAKDDKKGIKKKIFNPLTIIIVLAVIAGLVIFQTIRNKPEGKNGWLRISGRIEGYEVNVGAKIAGRVMFISNREGEEVKAGQPLVRLSDEDIQAQLRGAKARYDEVLAAVDEAKEQVKSAQQQVVQAQLNVTQSQEDAKGRVNQAAANVASQKALLVQAEAQEIQSKADLELARVRKQRYDELVVKGAVTQDEDDQAHATYDGAVATVDARRAAVESAHKQVKAAEAALLLASSNLLNPPIRFSQQQQNSRTVAQYEASLVKAQHDVKNAKAAIDEIEANIVYLNINSPINGVVTARTVEPGAVVAAGQTVISLIDLHTVFLRAYVPDSEIGKVRLHQRCNVYYDSDPKKGLEAEVIEIDPQASFTPENIYFRDDRVKQVFGIKIAIKNPAYFAKPGMPADADIDVIAESEQQKRDDEREEHRDTRRIIEKRDIIETDTVRETNLKDKRP